MALRVIGLKNFKSYTSVSQYHEELNKIQETSARADCVMMELSQPQEDLDKLVPDHDIIVR